MKTKETIKAYNKEYFARPEVIARAKIRNAQRRNIRKLYKKSEVGKMAEKRYRMAHKQEINERTQRNRLKSRYGITVEQFEELKAKYNGICPICGETNKRFHIDHSHTTGKVRGILCTTCNMGLGLFKDREDLLFKAIQYLQDELHPDDSNQEDTSVKQEDTVRLWRDSSKQDNQYIIGSDRLRADS